MAYKAIECYKNQTWPLKELVVLNATGSEINVDLKCIRCSFKPTLIMQDLAVKHALGEWCVNWRDDCWFDKDYVSILMNQAQSRNTKLVASPIAFYDVRDNRRFTGQSQDLAAWFRLSKDFTDTCNVNATSAVLRFCRCS